MKYIVDTELVKKLEQMASRMRPGQRHPQLSVYAKVIDHISTDPCT